MKSKAIHLGFEIGTGEPVAVPLRHMAVTGQTQQSGKTTTLEALITRAGGTALTFVTKRGEGSFATGRRVQPYFRDRADWQFVDALLEAILAEKNKMLRAPIIKICRNTKTLADVQREVKRELKTARGFYEGAFTQLDAYLDLIVPEIENADLADSLDLSPGINVMDVSAFRTPMQMLFIQSALDWVNEHATHTTVVIPEAWEFVPEGKGSPVKASAVTLVRKGAAERIQNHIWLDSQDMAGVDKTILRGCTVWLIGVQREANEIKRNLQNIPAGMKRPRADEIASLEIGQFFACFGKTTVKVYVQPEWMCEADAEAIARGTSSIDDVSRPPAARPTNDFLIRAAAASASFFKPAPAKEDEVDKATADALTAENERLKGEVADAERRGFERARKEASLAVANRVMAIGMSIEHELTTVGRRIVGELAEMRLDTVGSFVATEIPSKHPASAPKLQRALAKPPVAVGIDGGTEQDTGPPSSAAMTMLAVLVEAHPVPVPAAIWGVALNRSPASGPWHKLVKTLRNVGWAEGDASGYSATAQGIKASGEEQAGLREELDLWKHWRSQIASEIGSAALAMLETLATHRGHDLTNEQWGLLSNRSHKSGPWHAAKGPLRAWGLVDEGTRTAITEKGLALFDPCPRVCNDTGEALRSARRAGLESLPQRIYDALQGEMTRQQLADKLSMSSKSGPWHKAIKELIGSGLVAEDGGKIARKAEDLG